MKGYAFADLDGNLTHKTWDYINTVNPAFFSQNRHLIIKHWIFDTEDKDSMVRMLRFINDLKLSRPNVLNFLKSIEFDPKLLKEQEQPIDASKI